MIAKTKDGKEVFYDYKVYMPMSPAYGRGDQMVYGPFRKSGMIADSSLQPLRWREEFFEIRFPYEDKEVEGKKQRVIKNKELDIWVKIWHFPAGGDPKTAKEGEDKFLFTEKKITVTLQ